ncbi:MAG: hypothetical protein V4437_01105 [Patescibacteria group bacterium]
MSNENTVQITHDRSGFFKALEDAYSVHGGELDGGEEKKSGKGKPKKDWDTLVREFLAKRGF